MFSGFAAGSERVTFLSLALVLVARACWSGPSAQGCALEVPVYDRMANRLAFAITAVKEKDSGSDFLAADRHHRMKASGEWLYFPEVDLQRSFLITLSDAKSRKITVQVPSSIATSARRSRTRRGPDGIRGFVLTRRTLRLSAAACRMPDSRRLVGSYDADLRSRRRRRLHRWLC